MRGTIKIAFTSREWKDKHESSLYPSQIEYEFPFSRDHFLLFRVCCGERKGRNGEELMWEMGWVLEKCRVGALSIVIVLAWHY